MRSGEPGERERERERRSEPRAAEQWPAKGAWVFAPVLPSTVVVGRTLTVAFDTLPAAQLVGAPALLLGADDVATPYFSFILPQVLKPDSRQTRHVIE